MADKVGLFYGTNTGVTEQISLKVKKEFDKRAPGKMEIIDIGMKGIDGLKKYQAMIVASPTWNIGELQDDWDLAYPKLLDIDFSGKKVAMLGVGDQYGYPENFCDAIGILGRRLEQKGAELIGFTDATEFEFNNSLGVEDGIFLGLAIDEVNEETMTDDRIEDWVDLLLFELNISG